ncbi:MAG: hypothetical protein HYZ53_07445 [Planctomycetes bacterium]|nr:hypothetical protein [Planctomycetota bacterium]
MRGRRWPARLAAAGAMIAATAVGLRTGWGAAHTPTALCHTLRTQTQNQPIPIAPAGEGWYDRLDDAATSGVNEAALDLATVVDPHGGALRQHTYDWLRRGGRMVIIVGGTINEDSAGEWMPFARAWMRRRSHADVGCAVVPIVQINYKLDVLFGFLDRVNLLNPVVYYPSMRKGVRRAEKMIRKAAAAGSRDIWVLGLSKGSDITGQAVAHTAWMPQLKHAICFAVPYIDVFGIGIHPVCAPDPDPVHRRGGLFKYDTHHGVAYRGKFIVFNKDSDHIPNNIDPLALWSLFSHHHYESVLPSSAFQHRVEAMLDSPIRSLVDRAAGHDFDWEP